MANIEFEMGRDRLVVNEDVITCAKARELREAIKKVSDRYDERVEKEQEAINEVVEAFASRLEREENETDIAYVKRTKPILKEREEAAKKVSSPDKESHLMELAFECLKEVAKLVGQEAKVTRENFDAASWSKTKLKLAKVLIVNECQMGMLFLPPKSLS